MKRQRAPRKATPPVEKRPVISPKVVSRPWIGKVQPFELTLGASPIWEVSDGCSNDRLKGEDRGVLERHLFEEIPNDDFERISQWTLRPITGSVAFTSEVEAELAFLSPFPADGDLRIEGEEGIFLASLRSPSAELRGTLTVTPNESSKTFPAIRTSGALTFMLDTLEDDLPCALTLTFKDRPLAYGRRRKIEEPRQLALPEPELEESSSVLTDTTADSPTSTSPPAEEVVRVVSAGPPAEAIGTFWDESSVQGCAANYSPALLILTLIALCVARRRLFE